MIEIWGARHAAGRNVFRLMAITTVLTAGQYAVLLSAVAIALIWGPRSRDLVAALAGSFPFCVLITIGCAGLVVSMLTVTESQRVSQDKPIHWHTELTEPSTFWFLAAYVSPIAFMLIMYGASRLADAMHLPGIVFGIFLFLIAALQAAWHSRFAYRVAVAMRSEVKKGADLFRDFEWDHVSYTSEDSFRSRFKNPEWKFPESIETLAESDGYAKIARRTRLIWSVCNGLALLAISGFLIAAFKDSTMRMPHAKPEENAMLSLKWSVLFYLLLIPMALQTRVGYLDDLIKQYTNRSEKLSK